MEKHLLQSADWAAYQRLEGKQVFELEEKNYSVVATLEQTPVGNYLMVGYGPHAMTKASLKQAFKGLQSLAKTGNAFFVRIEPTIHLDAPSMAKMAESAGFKARKVKNIDPEHTWALDLDKTEEELLAGMEPRKVRYWRNHAKKGMKIRQTKDPEQISILTKMLAGLGERDHFTPQNEQHLKNQLKAGFATLYVVDLAEENGEEVPIAAALVYDFGGVRYYAHAATDDEHRKMMAGTILLIQMILDAKAAGQKVYDFWGMTPSEDPNHPWYGFTQYKKSFGGKQVDYSGTYDLILQDKKYKLYDALRKANLAVRKLRK